MELSRVIQRAYADYVDQYELEHLRMTYLSADAGGRIRLLKRLQRTYWGVPDDIARLAVEDPDRVVRAWYARNVGLRYGGVSYELEHDPDPLVRACLVEGRLAHDTWEKNATELERLAYLRCWNVREKFVLKLFDPENEELGLSQEDRTRYALTFLAARAAPGKIEKLSRGYKHSESGAGEPMGYADLAGSTGAELIGLMPKWPKNASIQDFVYRFCRPGGYVDIVYEHCDERRWRRLLLENVVSGDRWGWLTGTEQIAHMFALARKDPDDKCRELAHMDLWIGQKRWKYNLLEKAGRAFRGEREEKWERDRQAAFKQALKSRDLAAFQGLAQNKALKRRQLLKVARTLRALPDRGHLSSEDSMKWHAALWSCRETLQAIQEPQPEQVEEHERTTRDRPARQDSRMTQAKLDAVANWVRISLGFVATTIVWGWIGSAVGLLAGTVIYLLTGSLPLSVFAFASGLWAGVSIALLILFQFKSEYPDIWVGLLLLYRGMQPYPEETPSKPSRWPTREEGEEEIQTWRVFKHARKGRVEYVHDLWSERRQDSEVDIEAERQRIERYKAALTEARQR